jgi:hypothetical protein
LNFRITLEVEETDIKVESRGGLLPVDDIKTGVTGAVTPEVDQTPGSGRRLEPFVPLVPGAVSAYSSPGVLVFHSVPFSNVFLTDGISTTNTYFPVNPGLTKPVSQDAVQDFQVASFAASAEFGQTMGGVVDAATRSGTAAYHGEVHEYYRNPSLQSNDRFAAGYDTQQTQHQAGASVGGPLLGDNLFFFADFDALDRSGQGLNRITNPLLVDPTGTKVLSSNCQATAAQCSLATRFLQSQMNVLVPYSDHSYRGLAKIDYRRSDRNNLSFEGGALQWRAPALAETEDVAPNGGLLGDPILKQQTRFAKVGWTAAGTNQITNDMRVGFFQDRIAEDPSASGLSTGALGISIAGTTVGAPLAYTAVLPSEQRWQFTDIGNWTLGAHSIKVGFEYDRTRDYIKSLNNAGGWYDYPSFTAFAQDFGLTGQKNYTSFTQTVGNPARTINSRILAFFAEDTWRPTRRLTIDYALRYDRPRLQQPSETNTSYFQTASVTAAWLDLSPRVGFAYMLNDRTVLRAGFGFYYAPYTGQLQDALFLGNGLYQTSVTATPSVSGAPSFPNIFQSGSTVPTGITNVFYSQSTFKDPYTQQTSVSLERHVGSGTVITLSLMHLRGMKLWTTQDANLGSSTTETYTIDNASGQSVGTYTTQFWTSKGSGNFAHVFQIENGGSSWYNAAALQVRRRLSHGMSVQASYTFSHSIDDGGQIVPFGTAATGSANSSYTSDKGNSAFDQKHHSVIQWLWEPTVSDGKSAALRRFVNGWQFSGLATLASSLYATPIVIVQGQQFSGVTMPYTSSLNGSGGWNRVPFLGIGTLPLGAQHNVDARISRSFPITERIRAVALFEAFNLFNSQYATSVNTIAFTAFAPLAAGLTNGTRTGVLTPVTGLGQGIAGGGYPDGTNARRAQVGVRILF